MSKTYHEITEILIDNIGDTDRLAVAVAEGLGPWFVPLSNGAVFGWALYAALSAESLMGPQIATAVGLAAMVSVITAGIISTKNAAKHPGGGYWSLVVGYIFLELAGLWLMSVPLNVQIVGTVAALMSLIVYVSRAAAWTIGGQEKQALVEQEIATEEQDQAAEEMAKDRDQERVQAAEDRAAERDRQDRLLDQKHAERIALIESGTGTGPGTGGGTMTGQDREEMARNIMATEDVSGSELGRRLGLTEGGGRKLKKRIEQNGHK